MKALGAAVGGSGALVALAASGWGLIAVAVMAFVICVLVLFSDEVNRRFLLAIAALKARPSEPPPVGHTKTHWTHEVDRFPGEEAELVDRCRHGKRSQTLTRAATSDR